jgi:hypothetical protein
MGIMCLIQMRNFLLGKIRMRIPDLVHLQYMLPGKVGSEVSGFCFPSG